MPLLENLCLDFSDFGWPKAKGQLFFRLVKFSIEVGMTLGGIHQGKAPVFYSKPSCSFPFLRLMPRTLSEGAPCGHKGLVEYNPPTATTTPNPSPPPPKPPAPVAEVSVWSSVSFRFCFSVVGRVFQFDPNRYKAIILRYSIPFFFMTQGVWQ